MHIGDRQLGPGFPPYVIAELGVNHDGSVERALELTREAHAAGADAIKLQLFRTDLLMSAAAKLAAYQKAAGETDPISMLRRLELSPVQMMPVLALARQLGIHAIVTVFSVELVAEAEEIARVHGGWDAYKTASPDIIHRPLLDALAATGRPLIVSTGASTMDEVARAVDWLSTPRRERRLAVLQCVSSYPTPEEDAALGGISAIAGVLPGVPVGYSDHTASEVMGATAAAAGACILEKHFTYDRAARGPDHAASLDFAGLKRYIANVRAAFEQRKYCTPAVSPAAAVARATDAPARAKHVQDRERDVRTVSRQSIVSRRALPVGHRLVREDITFKRPGTGIPPFALADVLGAALVRPVSADMPIGWADLGREPPHEELPR
jgi:sialic acid synthase SpsE